MIVIGTSAWLSLNHILGPKLIVSDLDLGVFMPGQVVERALSIENRGWKSLVLNDVKTCCGVALPLGYPKKIRPLSASFVVLRVHLPFTYSPWNKTLLLETNDRHNPVTKINLRAQPDPALKIEPPTVDMGYIISGKHFTDIARIHTSVKKKPLRYITASAPYLKPSLRELASSGSYTVDIEVSKDAPRGKVKEYLYVKTDTLRRGIFIIPIFATIERGLRARPEQVFFGVVGGETVISRHIRLKVISPQWKTFEIETSDFNGVTAKVVQKNLDTFDLYVSLDPTKIPLVLDSFIRLRSSSGDIMRIPLVALRTSEMNNTEQNKL